jgi:hypothetical protein
VANYNVDIELAVKGNQRVERQLKQLEELVVKIGSKAKNIDLGGQIRLKGEQRILKEKIKNFGIAQKELKVSQEIARLASQRARGLSQHGKPIGPSASGFQEFRKEKRILELSKRLNAVEASRTKRLQRQNSLTSGLLKLNKASLQAARAEAQARGENLHNQRQLNRELAKSQQYNKPIGPKSARAGRGMAGGGGRGAQNLALGIGFPLLFGGGVGSVAGGALGSAGGMGGQVLGSAIGGIIDRTVGNIAKLGQALNPLTADIEAVTTAAGESGTSFERLTRELEEAVGKEKALAVATEQLATIIGQDGVDALQEFGEETTLLGNEVSQALSIISSALAEFVNRTGLLAKLISNIDESSLLKAAKRDTTDPELNRLKTERKSITPATAKTTVSFLGIRLASDLEDQLDANQKLIISRQRELEIEKQLEIVKGANAAIDRKKASLTKAELAVREADYKVIQLGSSLLEEKAYQAARSVVFANTALAVKKAENDTSKVALIMADEKNKLEELRVRRTEQAAAGAKSTARSGVATGRKAQRDADRAEKERLRSLKSGEKLILGLEKQLAINSSSFEFTKEFAAADFEREALQLRINDLLDEEQQKTAAILADRQAAMAGAGIFANMDDPSEMIGFDQAVGAGQTLQLSEQEEAIDKILEKYPMIGEAASAAAGVVTLGVNEMINGTKSVEEVFSDFLKNIGDMLIQAAQQMIATYIAIGIAKMFAGMGSGLEASGGGEALGPLTGSMPFTEAPAGFKFAEGGYVTGPTNALIGEGGEPEYVIPESKMRESMGRYSRGSRGGSVIPANGGGGDASGGGTATLAPIDVRYTVERINSVDYVTADQFQAGMREAASSGAKQGEQRALFTLRQNTTQRRRIGI